MANPLISIIVPVYKVEKYLDECVASIVNQTYENLEIILVDDGSPDRCSQMCDKWAAKDPRIRVIHKENGGAAAARNAGLDVVRGEYIGFVDSDDYIEEDMYEVLLCALLGSDKKIASCLDMGCKTTASHGKRAYPPRMREMGVEETLKEVFAGRVGTSVWRRLFERSVFCQIRFPEGEINEEYPILIPLTVAAQGTVQVLERLYHYRSTADSVTATCWKKDGDLILRNLGIMHSQLIEYRLDCMEQFEKFALKSVFNLALALDSHYEDTSDRARVVFWKCLEILRGELRRFLRRGYFSKKSRMLYFLLITRLRRPLYRLIGKL